jgi:ubiquinol-cytochrome c reductase cytochrome b subunit
VALGTFVVSFLALMYLGRQPSSGLSVTLARVFTVLYFAFFWLMPIYQKFDKVKPVPRRVTFHGSA